MERETQGRGRCDVAGDRNRGAVNVITGVQREREQWRAAYPEEFDDGFEIGLFGKAESARDPGGGEYPLGFHEWSGSQKNAWFSGFNLGYFKRLRIDSETGVMQVRPAADGSRDGQRRLLEMASTNLVSTT
jgi:hypothetical protein